MLCGSLDGRGVWRKMDTCICLAESLCCSPEMLGAGILHIECILHIAYWVQHFPQHRLSGSGIAQLEFYHCWEPAWRTLPMAKVMRKEARHTQRWDRASGVPLEILEHLPPKPESAYFLLSPTPLTLRGAVGQESLVCCSPWGRKESGMTGWLNNNNSVDRNLSELWEIVQDRKAWCIAVHGVTKSWTWLSDWITITTTPSMILTLCK